MEALLLAVKATNDFEAEMAKRFGGGEELDGLEVSLCNQTKLTSGTPQPFWQGKHCRPGWQLQVE